MCKELIHTDHPFTIHTLNCDTYLAITDRPTRTRIGGRQIGRIQWSAMSGHGGARKAGDGKKIGAKTNNDRLAAAPKGAGFTGLFSQMARTSTSTSSNDGAALRIAFQFTRIERCWPAAGCDRQWCSPESSWWNPEERGRDEDKSRGRPI